MEIQLNFIVKVYFIIHNLQRLLQEDLNGCWSCEVYTNDVELFKCIPSQENEIWWGIYRFYRMQNGLLLGGIQCKGGSCDSSYFIHIGAMWGAIFLCEKLPLDGSELVLAIHRSRGH